MEADPALFSLKDILTTHDDPTENVVQVEGMVCVGVPIGSPQFVQAFVAEKSKTMVEDLRSCSSSLSLASTSSLSASVTTRDLRTSTAPWPRRQWRIRPVGYKRWTSNTCPRDTHRREGNLVPSRPHCIRFGEREAGGGCLEGGRAKGGRRGRGRQ